MVIFNLVEWLRRQHAWSVETFGPHQAGQVDHIRKELIEIEADPTDLTEWVDVAVLALDGAMRNGHAPEDVALQFGRTLNRNIARQWPDWRTQDPNKAIEHVRETPRGNPYEHGTTRSKLHGLSR